MNILARPAPDTIRFFVPCSIEELDALPFAVRSVRAFFRPGEDSAPFQPSTFYPFTIQELEALPSSYDLPALSPWRGDNVGLYIQLSLPKVFRGHSLWHPGLEDFKALAAGLHEALLRIWPDCPMPSLWRITRLDLSVNYQCYDVYEVQAYRSQLARLRYKGDPSANSKKKNLHMCYWPGRTHTVKFYAKGLEILKTDNPGSLKVIDHVGKKTLVGQALPVLRFEVEYHRERLQYELGVKHSKHLYMDDVIEWYSKLDYNSWLNGFFKFFDRPGPARSLSDIWDVVESMPKSAIYSNFVRAIIDFGLDHVRSTIPKNTFNDRLRNLRKFGIEPAHLESHFTHMGFSIREELGSIRDLPLNPGWDGIEHRDDFSSLVAALSSEAVAPLKKKKNSTQGVSQNESQAG